MFPSVAERAGGGLPSVGARTWAYRSHFGLPETPSPQGHFGKMISGTDFEKSAVDEDGAD